MKKEYIAILAVDFDKTIADTDFPTIFGLKEGAKDYINRLSDDGFYIILYTCRCGDALQEAVNFLVQEGVKFNDVNENHVGLTEYFCADSRKCSADIYIDDRCLQYLLNPELLEWPSIYESVHKVVSNPTFNSMLNYLK